MRQRIAWVSVFFLGGIASVLTGLHYFETRVRPRLDRPQVTLNFQLLDVEGDLYDSLQKRASRKSLIVYLPDDLSLDTQKNFSEVVRQEPKAIAKKLNLILISRLDVDNLHNMKRLSGYSGIFLRDPSGSILQKFSNLDPTMKRKDWLVVELGSQGEILRRKSAVAPELSWLE